MKFGYYVVHPDDIDRRSASYQEVISAAILWQTTQHDHIDGALAQIVKELNDGVLSENCFHFITNEETKEILYR